MRNVKFGFLTNALVNNGRTDIHSIIEWAKQEGFDTLEVGPSINLLDLESALEATGMNVSALTYCRNFLSEDLEMREMHQKELFSRIEAAGRLGIPLVVTSTGINSSSMADSYDGYDAIRSKPSNSLKDIVSFFSYAGELAEKANVKIAFENCPLMGNTAISPELWSRLFDQLDSSCFGLAYDPSHLIWQGIDPYIPVNEFADRIFHVHAKDTEIDYDRLNRTGILTDFSWWRYRLPGLGDLDWSKFIQELIKIGYNGAVSIEHEDPVWEGSLQKIKKGLLLGKDHIKTSLSAALTK